MDSKSIIGAVESVTKEWAKQRKAEERDSRARSRRNHYSTRVNFTDVLNRILPVAYKHASGGGRYSVSKRQMYYASRDAMKAATGRDVGANYFSQTLLVKYLNENPQLDWKITADPRGTLVIPNASHEVRIPCGTIAIDQYLLSRHLIGGAVGRLPIEWPAIAEGQRYAGVLYIEKEGFEPILKEARIAERFDLAVVSCKGQSVVAARKLVDHVCRKNGGVPLFVAHDFDKSGFEICDCLTSVSAAARLANRVQYRFKNKINVVDFGLRIEDVDEYDLASEDCKTHDYYPDSMTQMEVEFMRQGKRVELNAFTAPQLVEWLETKLKEHLPERLVPDEEILAKAYRRALVINRINEAITNIIDEEDGSDTAALPDSLRDKVVEAMAETGEPWDVALASIATDEGGAE